MIARHDTRVFTSRVWHRLSLCPGNLGKATHCWVRVSGTCSGPAPRVSPSPGHNTPTTSTAVVMSNPTTGDSQQPYLSPYQSRVELWRTVHINPDQLCTKWIPPVYRGCSNIGAWKQEAGQIMLWMVIILAGACQSNNGPWPHFSIVRHKEE